MSLFQIPGASSWEREGRRAGISDPGCRICIIHRKSQTQDVWLCHSLCSVLPSLSKSSFHPLGSYRAWAEAAGRVTEQAVGELAWREALTPWRGHAGR